MRVLHVSRFFHPRIGGTENHIADLAATLAGQGVESTVLATRRHASGQPRPRVRVLRVAAMGPDWFPVPVEVHAIRGAVRTSDIVHVHDLRFAFELVTLLALAEGVPLAFSSHGLVFHTQRLRLLKKLLWSSYYRALLGRFTVVLCVSEQDLALCRAAGLRNARLFPNPVRTAQFEVVNPKPQERGALLYFGRLAPNKGIERLAAVLSEAPSWTLSIVGKGDRAYEDRLSRSLAHLGSRAQFHGAVSDSDLPELIAIHDCVVLPSYAEGFGLTLVEAMATGVPVVASDIPAYREVASATPVRLVDFDQPNAVVRCVRAAMETWDPIAARQCAHRYSWQRRGGEFLALYECLSR